MTTNLLSLGLALACHPPGAACPGASGRGVVQILDRHDRALIRDLAAYLRRIPRPTTATRPTRPSLTSAIEHDWFAEIEEPARQYLKYDPDGPVKALAQIIQTMARAHAGQFDLALVRYRELMHGLGQNDQEEFAASFSETLAGSAVTAGEFTMARQVYQTLPLASRRAQTFVTRSRSELGRLEKVGKPAPAVRRSGSRGQARPGRTPLRASTSWSTSGRPGARRASPSFRGCRPPTGITTTPASRSSASASTRRGRRDRFRQGAQASLAPDPQRDRRADLVEAFGVSSIPAAYLLDPAGKVVRLDLRGPALEATLARLMSSQTK